MKLIDGDSGFKEYQLSNGKVISAHCEIIGLDPDGNIYQGYDGVVYDPDQVVEGGIDASDVAEIADYMIERWKAVRDQANGDDGAQPCSATVTLTDRPDEINIQVEFFPEGEDTSPSHHLACQLLEFIGQRAQRLGNSEGDQ